MIVTVSFNPAIDQTIDVKNYEYAGVNRIENCEVDAGGKGINVAKNLKILGEEPTALGFIGGRTGQTFKEMISNLQIRNDFTYIYGETRINTKIVEEDGTITEFNAVGPEILQDRINELMIKIDGYATENTLFVISGKVPPGVDANVFKNIIKLAHNRGSKVAVDSAGALFAKAVEEKPEIIKVKLKDIERVHEKENMNDEEIVEVVKKYINDGIKYAAISMGERGAIFANSDEVFKCSFAKVKTHSTVGASDALLAGLVYGIENRLEFEKTAKLATAMSVGAVMTIGTKPSSKEMIKKLYEDINITKF